ncbi:MAG TPA: hypothetical protein PLH92_06585 [Mycobacterium sp.]|uniref:hypothetical protein n=1 Tax=Mycolicibacterium sp. TaxID=2320850 RepID=UPI0025F7976A|nr:hypothetical protein [Mycolicibacterium sp.]HPX36644.1 hypothetical protein [Mycobacterium sp.]HQC76370.1 hypothetical protein [Mycobacterium sp.]
MVDCPLAAVLAAGAATLGEPALTRLAADLDAPIRVRVCGRPGAGVPSVVRALQLACPEVAVCSEDGDPELRIRVIVESFADEDGRPDVAVLNKADLIGFAGAGPMAAAVSRCAELRRRTGVPTVGLSAPVAVAALDPAVLDDELFGALRVLAAGPARPDAAVRGRLLAELDLFGIANAVAALRAGADRTAVRTALRGVSGVDEVGAEIARAAAPARYRRIGVALAELTTLAAGPDGARLAGFLAGDEVVLARMAAAADVVRSAGLARVAGPDHLRADQLCTAIGWRRYADGPVSELHRACGADLARGSLRLWGDRR